MEQGGRIDSQAKPIGWPYYLFQFACIHITFHQYEFGLDLTKEWRLSFSIERKALPRVRTSSTGRSFRPSGSSICSPSSPKRCVRPCVRVAQSYEERWGRTARFAYGITTIRMLFSNVRTKASGKGIGVRTAYRGNALSRTSKCGRRPYLACRTRCWRVAL